MEDLLTRAAVIRDEVNAGANTSERVGGLLVDTLKKIAEVSGSEQIDGKQIDATTFKIIASDSAVKISFLLLNSSDKTPKVINIPLATETKAGIISPTTVKKINATGKTLQEHIDKVGKPGGIAQLDASGLIPTSQMPIGESEGTAFDGLRGKQLEDKTGVILTASYADIDDCKAEGLYVITDDAAGVQDLMLVTSSGDKGTVAQFLFSSADREGVEAGVHSRLMAGDTWAEWQAISGGGGTLKGITFNGVKYEPDETGEISFGVDIIQVDDTLDENSSNAIQNAAVSAKFGEIEANTVFSLESEVDEDANTVKLSIKNKQGAEIASTEFSGGSGSGGPESGTATKIVLTSSVDNDTIKEGSAATLSYFYDHQYSSGDDAGNSTGQKASITIQMLRGAQTVYSETVNDVSKGTYTLDISKYLFVGTTDIYVRATTVDPEGKTQTKQAYTSVKVVTLSLKSSYNIASPQGGYLPGSVASIPFTLSGTGNKVVTLYVDGEQRDTKTISKSGQTNSSFSLPMDSLTVGRHTVQMVAEMVASDTLTIRSESIYMDICKAGEDVPFVGIMHSFTDGRIFTDDHLTPTLPVGQYEKLQFDFVGYDPQQTPAEVSVWCDGVKTQTVSVPRTAQVYNNRFSEQGEYEMEFRCGSTVYQFAVEVDKSSIDIEETKADLLLKLTASGRSNEEGNPATWTYGDVTTKFSGFDWESNGWTGDSLLLTNGAAIEIEQKPFEMDAATLGGTYEFELKCSNITDRKGVVISCMDGNVGFKMTAQEALLAASGGSSVNTPFASGLNYKIAFVVGKKGDSRLLEFYVNGIRCGAKQYAQSEGFKQENPANITVSSDSADVELRNLRIYARSLTDDEVLTNYIVDRPTSDEMIVLFKKNDVMNDDGSDVDIEKLRAQGKSVMRIVGDVELVNATNNKKFEVPADVYFFSKYGKEYDFVLKKAGLRIQGTSSTTYPRKNYRIYFLRSDKYGTTLEVNGVDVPDLLYAFRPGAKRVGINCLKADFSDSSSTHNTGAVRMINDVWQKCGWLTPPQKVDPTVRIGVDGIPIDCFYDNDNSNINVYLGKYNFNNEKSGSAEVYGFEGIAGFNDTATLKDKPNKCVCVEFLNNSHPLCLFGSSNITAEEFENGLEFRFKSDKTWDTADEADRTAVKRLWTWINSCKDNHAKFAAEYKDYFGGDSPFAWYVITDYLMAVDSRAKNMMLSTWDGMHWYFLPYDLDTILGCRNDSVLKYDYTITHDTFDDSIGSYAFAGHDSILWQLVRSCPDKLREVASLMRSNMSTEDVLKQFNEEMMGNWCERIYNKDGEFKYIKPLTEGVTTSEGIKYYDYLYALQGSRYAHRTYTIQNRFALLDSQYLAGTYRQDSFPVYFGYKFSKDSRKVKITSSERYYFGYGYTSGEPKQSCVLAENDGSAVDLTLDTDLIVNDPQYFYGASRMQGLDLTDVSHAIVGTLNLNNCTTLRNLNISCEKTQKTLTALLVGKCRNLREVNITGLQAPNFTSVDLSTNTKLEKLIAGNTALTGISFAKGAPLATAVLPATLQTLELRYLNKLSNQNLTLEGTSNISRLVVDSCKLINWQKLLDKCTEVKYLRITGITAEGDGSLLRNLMQTGGVDENGGNVSTCRLVGTYKLTHTLSDDEYATLSAHFPELNIVQPQYTMIEFDEIVSDDANISNLDNMTGYKYNKPYMPNGHISAILNARHRVLAKVTKKPTTRNVNMAGIDTTVNNLDGEMTYYPLHDEDSTKYVDGSEAKLDGSEGDWMMYEPFFWSKGINDYLNNKKYSCYSFRPADQKPDSPVADILTLQDLRDKGDVTANKKVLTDKEDLASAYKSDQDYSVCKVAVSGYKRVRFPSIPGTQLAGSLFTGKDDAIVKKIVVPTLACKFEPGMYLVCDVPDGATHLHFTILNSAEFDMVVLSNSDKIEDIEPDWVANDEHLCGVVASSIVNTPIGGVGQAVSRLRACVTGVGSVGGISWSDFHFYSVQRGMQQIDALMHSRIANLAFAKYGRRNMQEQCGAGRHIYDRLTGDTAAFGMTDTIGYEEAKSIKDNISSSFIDGMIYQYAWYKIKDSYGADTVKQVDSICCIGYENIFGGKYDMMDGVDMPNTKGNIAKWRIWMPDGSKRYVKGSSSSGIWVTAVSHGKHMDVVPVGTLNGLSSSHYSDMYWQSTASSRVLLRGGNNANANDGVANANASYDSSWSASNAGSRLAN